MQRLHERVWRASCLLLRQACHPATANHREWSATVRQPAHLSRLPAVESSSDEESAPETLDGFFQVVSDTTPVRATCFPTYSCGSGQYLHAAHGHGATR